ncbi:HAD family hydrolase [Cystobacter fuscus]
MATHQDCAGTQESLFKVRVERVPLRTAGVGDLRGIPEFGSFDKLVIEPARIAFKDARRKYLQPFPGVIETLEKLKHRGIPVVALTDAPRNPVEVRAKQLKLDQLLDAIYCLPGFDFPKNEDGEMKISRHIKQKEQKGEYRTACRLVELPRDYEKPNPLGLRRICEEMHVSPRKRSSLVTRSRKTWR